MVALRYVLFAAVAFLLVTLLAAKDAEAHNWYPDDGCAPGPGPNGYFWAAGPASGWGTVANGWNGCSMWTISKTNDPPDQYAEWYTPTTSSYSHTYRLQMYVPDMGATCAWLTTSSHWHRYENGTVAGIYSHYHNWSQSTRCSDACWTVGVGYLSGPNGGKVDMWDSTGEVAARYIMVDVFCFRQ